MQEKSAFEDNTPFQFTSAHTASAQGTMGSCTLYRLAVMQRHSGLLTDTPSIAVYQVRWSDC
jgi:hypothetical protein